MLWPYPLPHHSPQLALTHDIVRTSWMVPKGFSYLTDAASSTYKIPLLKMAQKTENLNITNVFLRITDYHVDHDCLTLEMSETKH